MKASTLTLMLGGIFASSLGAFAMGGAPYSASAAEPQSLLNDSGDVSAWKRSRAPYRNDSPEFPWIWNAEEKSLSVCYNWCGDIETVRHFGNFFLHVEFKTPQVDVEYHEQQKGNSGIYLQGRYELQILDSYNHPLEGKNDLGAFYEIADASVNAAKPVGAWQAYDIQFSAPQFDSKGVKTKNAKVSVWLNGIEIHHERDLPHPTAGGTKEEAATGPIRLQDHMDPMGRVEFRNIWIRE